MSWAVCLPGPLLHHPACLHTELPYMLSAPGLAERLGVLTHDPPRPAFRSPQQPDLTSETELV